MNCNQLILYLVKDGADVLQVMTEMGAPFSGMEVASFMSCSKGYMGECGMR